MRKQAIRSLLGAVPLSHHVSVYVPSKDRDGAPLPEDHSREVAAALAALFGGSTVTDAAGFWATASGSTIEEGVRIVFAYAAELTEESVSAVAALARNLKDTLRQEAVAVEIDGALYLV